MKQKSGTRLMRAINRSAILNTIRENGPLTRSQIAKMQAISLPTVIRVVTDLLKEELVIETGSIKSTGGRPSATIDLNYDRFVSISVDMGGSKIHSAITDLKGLVLAEVRRATHGDDGKETSLDNLVQSVQHMLLLAAERQTEVLGIGVGVPGVVVVDDGLVNLAPTLGWHDMPLRQILSEHFELPIVIENDVNLAALGEHGFGAGRGADNLICIALGTGIGAGIILNGELYRGSNHLAGEIGYMLPSVDHLGTRYTGLGALEQVASGTGIERIVQTTYRADAGETQHITAKDVFAAARQGKPWAEELVGNTVDYVTMALANVTSLLDPEVIILSGGIMQSADLLLEPIKARFEQLLPVTPRIVLSSLGSRATILGATMLILTHVTAVHADQPLS